MADSSKTSRTSEGDSAFVFAPSPLLTVTIEGDRHDTPEIHLHAGGQGVWIARMLVTLGVETTMCAPLAGETGAVLRGLIADEGIAVRAAAGTASNGAYVHDRRSGRREEVAEMPPAPLGRHEVDDLYTCSLAVGLNVSVGVLGGPHAPDTLPADIYRRLAADLRAVGVPVVADLSGETLTAALKGGVTVLKASHEDLIEDRRSKSDDPADLIPAMRTIAEEGAQAVVVSRAGDPAMALIEGELVEIVPPPLQMADHRGAGDSMTAGIATALARGFGLSEALRLGAAAGAVNVTRHGLATGQRDVIERLAERVTVRHVEEQ